MFHCQVRGLISLAKNRSGLELVISFAKVNGVKK